MNSRIKTLSVGWTVVLITLLNMMLYHVPLYRFVFNNLDLGTSNGVMTFITLLVVVFVVTAFLLFALSLISHKLIKPFCMLAAVLNAIAVYFLTTYQVILDRAMMGNILNTKSEESLEFLSINLLLYVLCLGVLPVWLLSKLSIDPVKRLTTLLLTTAMLFACLVFIYVNSSTWLWFDKHSKRLGGSIMPWSYIINIVRAQAETRVEHKERKLLPTAITNDDGKMVVVLVIGETARSQNFSLYGYDRNTNSRLSQQDVAIVNGAKSCSTYTTASLHCMLSHNGQSSGEHETLPSYLQRHNVDVIWRANNWGEPPLTVGTYETAGDLRPNCIGENCAFDDVLLTGLNARITASSSNKVFITMHTKGSHGPAYNTRYPSQYEVFKPVCKSVELAKCSQQSLVNAYDNTIVYTDSFLDRTIEILKGLNDIPTVFIYVSDHGESLGEYGLYLHGTPYTIAPEFQKNIPFIVWMSDKFRSDRQISNKMLEAVEGASHSHVFHSILGAFGMQSAIYTEELDIFSP